MEDFKSPIIITVTLGRDAKIEDGKVIVMDYGVERTITNRVFTFMAKPETFISLLNSMERFNGTKGITQIATNIQ